MKPTQEQVIALAREAGISTPWDQEPVPWKLLTGFATLAYEAGRKDENEACAKFCQQAVEESEKTNAELSTTEILEKAVISGAIHQARRIDAAIRARREQ